MSCTQSRASGGRRQEGVPAEKPPPRAVSSCPQSPSCCLVWGSRRAMCAQDIPTLWAAGAPTASRGLPAALCPFSSQREPPKKGPGSRPPTPHSSLASLNNYLSSRLCSNTFPGPPAKKAGFVLARAGLSSDMWALEATVLKKRPFSLATRAGVSLPSGGGDCGVQTWPHPSRGVPGSSDPSHLAANGHVHWSGTRAARKPKHSTCWAVSIGPGARDGPVGRGGIQGPLQP